MVNTTNKQNSLQKFKGKKVFLTGHTGFKGSWLLYWLHQLGATVKGYSLEPEGSQALYRSLQADKLCDSVIGDIRDRDKLTKAILDFKPDFVFHLAAQALVRPSYEKPSETFMVNAVGTAHVLDALRLLNGPCYSVMITTDKVYDNKEWIYPYRENDMLGGYDPYSASKACAELVISSYRNSFFNDKDIQQHQKFIASARAGNVIGGGDWSKDRIVPDIVRALTNKNKVILRNPYAVRPWEHVLEPLYGYLWLGAMLAEHSVSSATAWNFGPLAEDNRTVLDIVQTAIKVWGEGDYEVQTSSTQPHEAGLLKLDISKAVSNGWIPKWSSEEAIIRTISWYKEFMDGKTAAVLMETDIGQYTAGV